MQNFAQLEDKVFVLSTKHGTQLLKITVDLERIWKIVHFVSYPNVPQCTENDFFISTRDFYGCFIIMNNAIVFRLGYFEDAVKFKDIVVTPTELKSLNDAVQIREDPYRRYFVAIIDKKVFWYLYSAERMLAAGKQFSKGEDPLPNVRLQALNTDNPNARTGKREAAHHAFSHALALKLAHLLRTENLLERRRRLGGRNF